MGLLRNKHEIEATDLKVCDPCWDDRNINLDTHKCGSNPDSCKLEYLCVDFVVRCHCPCRE